MKLAHEVLLALAYVSQISDPDVVRSRFIESLNGLDEELTFEYAEGKTPPPLPDVSLCLSPRSALPSGMW